MRNYLTGYSRLILFCARQLTARLIVRFTNLAQVYVGSCKLFISWPTDWGYKSCTIAACCCGI